jgi:DNA-directed RNA polymerase specialized sigma24 family protein
MSGAQETGPARPDPDPNVVIGERDALTNVAYRLLGSLVEAEDAVQEAISSPGAWLNTVVSRICLDVLRSTRVRREQYVGEWLPEPLPDRTEWSARASGHVAADPADRITLDESVDMAFMVVLESMAPAERVAFLLHDVFRYSFAEVREIVGRKPGACRQLASRARRRIRDAQHTAVPPSRRAGIVRDFKRAWEARDIDALVGLLDPTVVIIADGGGRAAASPVPIEGGETAAAFLVDLAAHAEGHGLLERTVNGQPGLVGVHGAHIETVFAFEVTGDRITRIWAVRNPQKLQWWTDR